ncbi:MAG: hypothetical protein WBE72_16790 [Terracidiphilus sp.]
MSPAAVPDILAPMQAAAEMADARAGGSSVQWWESAPFTGSSSRGSSSIGSPGTESPSSESPSSESPSFFGVLSALAAPGQANQEAGQGWMKDGLEDDTATLSYEHALRAHGRHIAQEWPASPAGGSLGREAEAPDADKNPEPAEDRDSAAADGNRKSASITIRLTQEECAQLKRRAAEAGLTISAYLRSCTFEAEALRAQVKQALAELRTASSDGKRSAPVADARAPRRWWRMRSYQR